MQWEAFFHSIAENYWQNPHGDSLVWEKMGKREFGYGPIPLAGGIALNGPSDGDFGKDVHAADLGRHSVVGSLFFDPDDRRLAANPVLLSRGQFGRED